MASLRQALMASAAGGVLLVSALTYLRNEFTTQALATLAHQESSIAQATATFLQSNANLQGTTLSYSINGQQTTLISGSTTTYPVSALIAYRYLPPADAQLNDGAVPTVVLRNENGGVLIVVVPGNPSSPVSITNRKIGNFLDNSPWTGVAGQGVDPNDSSATLVALGGVFRGNASDYTVSVPSSGFVPVGWDWVSSARFSKSGQTGSPIASLKPGQSYTDSNGNIFTAYNSSQGVVIKAVSVTTNNTGTPLWFPQSVFSQSSPSLSRYYLPSGTGTGYGGSGPYSLTTNGNSVEGFWYGQHLANYPLSDFG